MASDKARFYLEQQVPELQEYERKQIFTRDEITAIAKKRSDFEHILNARGSKAGDYVRYATYEMNLDTLRKKRCKRLGVKATAHSGQRTTPHIGYSPVTVTNAAGRVTANATRSSARIATRFRMKKSAWLSVKLTVACSRSHSTALEKSPSTAVPAVIASDSTTRTPQMERCSTPNGPPAR